MYATASALLVYVRRTIATELRALQKSSNLPFPKKTLSFPRRTAAEGGKIKGGMFEIPSKIDTSPDHNAQGLLEEARL